jgi:hypothetical protein
MELAGIFTFLLLLLKLHASLARVSIGENLSDKFLIKSGLKKEMLYHHRFSTLLWNMLRPREPGRTEIEWDTSAFSIC